MSDTFTVLEKPVQLVGSYRIHGKKALVREDNNQVLDIVNETYKVVQNDEFFGRLEDAFKSELGFEEWSHEDKLHHAGRTIYRDYKFPTSKIQMPNDSKADINFRIVARNSHGKHSMCVYSGAIDMFCTNGIISGEFTKGLVPHTKHAAVWKFNEIVNNGHNLYRAQTDTFGIYAGTELDITKAKTFLKTHKISKKAVEAIEEQVKKEIENRGKTVWAFISALTWWATHYPTKGDDVNPTRVIDRQREVRALTADHDVMLKLAA